MTLTVFSPDSKTIVTADGNTIWFLNYDTIDQNMERERKRQ
jgi:hypothetical protein